MEIAIRWSQRSTADEPRFLIADVTGRTFKLCKVVDYRNGQLQWQEVSRNSRAPSFRAFDWSFAHDLVAVGQWSGETAVLGLENGSRGLSFPIKSQRQCNAVSFNSETLLATGLDRVRNDFCLHVYDMNQWLAGRSLSSTSTPTTSGLGLKQYQTPDPLRKYATSEGITSIKFLPQEPHIVIAGVKGTCVRTYDLRESTGNPALQFQSMCVHNIAVNPCDQNYFASASPMKDSTVHIWDRRMANRPNPGSSSPMHRSSSYDAPVLELKDIFKNQKEGDGASIWSLRYSPTEDGRMGILGSNSALRIFQTKKEHSPGFGGGYEEVVGGSGMGRNVHLGWAATVSRPQLDARRTSQAMIPAESEKLLAFDFMNIVSEGGYPCALTLRGNQDVGILEMEGESPTLATSVRTEVSMSTDKLRPTATDEELGLQRVRTYVPRKDGSAAEALQTAETGHVTANHGITVNTFGEGWNDAPWKDMAQLDTSSSLRRAPREPHSKLIEEVLHEVNAPRRRVQQGYLFDAARNREIANEDKGLQWMWEWIEIAENIAANDRMVANGIDFSYLGVYDIWNEITGSSRNRSDRQNPDVADAISKLVTQLDIPEIPLPETSKSAHRYLCLHTMGLTSPSDLLLADVKSLALGGRSSEAALRAFLRSECNLAATALRSGPRHQQSPALSLILSLRASNTSVSTLLPQIQSLVATTTDPFALAILSHLTDTPIQPPHSLPPLYSLASAVLSLSDSDLTAHLKSLLFAATSSGSLQHVPLTGLSPQSHPLFSTYLNRTSDIATFVLALSHTSPRFDKSSAIAACRTAFRNQLNASGLFLERARFDVQATRLATDWTGQSTLGPAQRQVSLKCTGCERALHREGDGGGDAAAAGSVAMAKPTASGVGGGSGARVLGSPRDGTVCPRCGARLPRCVVCDHWVGEAQTQFTSPPRSTAWLRHGNVDTKTKEAGPGKDVAAVVARDATSGASGSGGGGSGTAARDFADSTADPRSSATDLGQGRGSGAAPAQAATGAKAGAVSAATTTTTTTTTTATVDPMAAFVEVCLRCRHVYHRAHAAAWFARHSGCAAVECQCRCAEADSLPFRPGVALQA